MEELLAEADAGFGLNIVCNKSSRVDRSTLNSVGTNNAVGKKKRNKYEIRRHKARLAKEENARKINTLQTSPSVQDVIQSKVNGEHDATTMETKEIPCLADKKQASSLPVISTISGNDQDGVAANTSEVEKVESVTKTRSNSSNSKNLLQDIDTKELEKDNNDESKDLTQVPSGKDDQLATDFNNQECAEIDTSSTTNTVDLDRKPSRRFHANDDNLEDEERRANYMAEFHAHPLEMDRRCGAVSTIKASATSSHIFMPRHDGDIESSGSHHNNNDEGGDETNAKSRQFTALGLNERLAHAITSERGPFRLIHPTVIQARALAALLPSNENKNAIMPKQPKNVFIQSETGSGKTLAYLLPILQSIVSATMSSANTHRSTQNLRTIIILPTRELAIQTFQTTLQLTLKSYSSCIVPVCLSGGEKRKSEKARLRKGVSILIGTPGRLLDHLQKTECLRNSLESNSMLDWLVLDEADRLLDMGLGHQVKQILEEVSSLVHSNGEDMRSSHTFRSVLVSATVTDEMQELARNLLCGKHVKGKDNQKQQWEWVCASMTEPIHRQDSDPARKIVTDGTKSDSDANESELLQQQNNVLPLANAAPRQLAQQHMVVSAKLRLPALIAFLLARMKQNQRVVVFMSTCDGVDYHHELFSSVDSILAADNENASSTKGLFGKYCNLYRLHGNVPHAERNKIIEKFCSDCPHRNVELVGKAKILFATDVAARGLNLPGVDWIVQYDPPCETADYIHRAGRTARAGKAGNAVLFLLPSERQYMEVLELKGLKDVGNTALSLSTTLQHAAEICPHLIDEEEQKSSRGSISSSRKGEAFASAVQFKLEEHIVQDTMMRKDEAKKNKANASKKGRRERKSAPMKDQDGLQYSARRAFTSFLRAYPTKEKAVRHIFSARALHLGHVARSFALKDPPKAVMRAPRGGDSRKKDQYTDDGNSGTKKRNSKLAFEQQEAKSTHTVFEKNGDQKRGPKRSKTKVLKGKFDGAYDGGTTPQDAKRKMMNAAKKIQTGNMEFF